MAVDPALVVPRALLLVDVGQPELHIGVVLAVLPDGGRTIAVSTSHQDADEHRAGDEVILNWQDRVLTENVVKGFPKDDPRPSYFYGYYVEDPIKWHQIKHLRGRLPKGVVRTIAEMYGRWKRKNEERQPYRGVLDS